MMNEDACNYVPIVEDEISKSIDGRVDPVRNRFDEFWQSLQRDPPVTWFSSIYGWPTDLEDYSKSAITPGGPTRYLIKSLDWRSLAFTRSPKNTGLTTPAKIISAKSYLLEMAKAHPWVMPPNIPTSMPEISRAGICTTCEVHTVPSLLGYRRHFIACKGCSSEVADVFAHALMHQTNMSRAAAFTPRKR